MMKSTENISCDPQNYSSILDLSELCIGDNQHYGGSYECFSNDISTTLSNFAGVWCIINAILGFSGNLLTLLAIPYACWKKRFGLQINSTTIFILNLALSDLLYCAINLPMYATQYLARIWPLGSSLCYANAVFRYINAFGDWVSVGIIAVSRCIFLLKPGFARRYLTKRNSYIICLMIWAYTSLIMIPLYTGDMGTFGYNCVQGKCDFLPTPKHKIQPQITFYIIGFSVPCVMVTVSYYLIWHYALASSTSLMRLGGGFNQQLKDRDVKMTWTILFVCISYFVFVMPISLLNIFDSKVWFPASHVIAFCIYWSQYSLNCVVYAVRSDQYRKAYVCFLMMLFDTIRRVVLKPKIWFQRKQQVTNTNAFVYIERSVLFSPLNSMCIEKAELKCISGNQILHLTTPSNNVKECSRRNQNYRRRVSSPSPAPVLDLPSFCIENVDQIKNRSAKDAPSNHRDSLGENESITQDIVPLGHVTIELAKSSFGEKLILVRNSRPNKEERRRSISLSQSATNLKKVENLFGVLKSNLKIEKRDDYESTVNNIDTMRTKTKILKSTTNINERKTSRQARIDEIQFIHEYFQSPQIMRRRRVQSN